MGTFSLRRPQAHESPFVVVPDRLPHTLHVNIVLSLPDPSLHSLGTATLERGNAVELDLRFGLGLLLRKLDSSL